MNPRLHDEFVPLCALFYSGEITDEEWALLQVHMAYCDSCRRTFEEFKHVAKEVIPAMASAAAAESGDVPHESAATLKNAEHRLMSRLETTVAPEQSLMLKKTSWRVYGGALAACIVVFLVFASFHFVRRQTNLPEQPHSRPAAQNSSSQAGLQVDSGDQTELKRQQAEVAELRQHINALEASVKGSDSAAAALSQQLQTERAQRDQDVSEKQSLTQQLATTQAAVQDLHGQMGSAQASAGDRATQIAALETKVRTLNAALEDANTALDGKDRMLALDKDFLAHDRDIRDLIGARNLYIADIYDATESGKTAKPFGRIFYTQDRSLVFYGFDLEKQAGLAHSVAFQAWGSGSDRQPVSLGLFYQDDSHKRWVVRCDDAKTLSRLNMVFVTVEPPGGSSKPTGKQLLRAYLQIQPNHP